MTEDVEQPTAVEPEPASERSSEPASEQASEQASRKSTGRTVAEWAILIVAAVAIAFVIKTYLFQAFYIPSASMEPTLMVGDRVLVNKLSYDLHDVHRGDVVVFASAPNPEWHKAGIDDLVKRVIGLPGETITRCDTDQVCVDGKVLSEPYTQDARRFVSPLSPEITKLCAPDSPEGGCKVPAGMVFVMGDNRMNSSDSRANGPVKQSSIVGRVFVKIWPPGRIGTM